MKGYRVGGSWGVTVVETEVGQPDKLVGLATSVHYAELVCQALREKEQRTHDGTSRT